MQYIDYQELTNLYRKHGHDQRFSRSLGIKSAPSKPAPGRLDSIEA